MLQYVTSLQTLLDATWSGLTGLGVPLLERFLACNTLVYHYKCLRNTYFRIGMVRETPYGSMKAVLVLAKFKSEILDSRIYDNKTTNYVPEL